MIETEALHTESGIPSAIMYLIQNFSLPERKEKYYKYVIQYCKYCK